MAEAVILNTPNTILNKDYDWNWAFNNSDFITYILADKPDYSYVGYDIYIPSHAYEKSEFTLISFPSCWQYIGARAFADCHRLKSAYFYSSTMYSNIIYDIEDEAFINAYNLESITINAQRNIGKRAFANCIKLSQINMFFYRAGSFGDKTWLTNIDDNAFENCYSLQNFNYMYNINRIGKRAFKGCTSLSNNPVGRNICFDIDDEAFADCTELRSVYLNGSFAYFSSAWSNRITLGSNIFKNCIKLESIEIDGTYSISEQTFGNLQNNLKNVSMIVSYSFSRLFKSMDLCPTIGPYTFKDYKMLSSVYISFIKEIGSHAFENCTALKYQGYLGNYYCESIGDYAFAGCGFSTAEFNRLGQEISEYSCYIGHKVFQSTKLSNIGIGNLVRIYSDTFEGLEDTLRVVNINYSWMSSMVSLRTDIDAYAFYNFKSLQNIQASYLKTIGSHAFENCTGISYAYYIGGYYCESIGEYAFAGCTSLEYISINTYGSEQCNIDNATVFSGCINLKSFITGPLKSIPSHCFNNANIQTIEVSVTSNETFSTSAFSYSVDIGSYAFAECQQINRINISAVKSIGDYAFYKASLSTGQYGTLSVGYGLCGGIGKYAFASATISYSETTMMFNVSCYSIANGYSVTCSIDDYAFANATFKRLTFYNVNHIGESIFNLANIISGGAITISGTLFSSDLLPDIPANTFLNPSNLAYYNVYLYYISTIKSYAFSTFIWNGVSTGGASYIYISDVKSIEANAFYRCQSLADITISGSISQLDSRIFCSCSNLKYFTCNNLKEIPSGMFMSKHCPGLSSVSLPNVEIVNSDAFHGLQRLSIVNLPACNEIKAYGFNYHIGLTYINSPYVSKVGHGAFQYCSNLATIMLNSCSQLGAYAFSSCENLVIASLPACESIQNSTFCECHKLETATLYMCSIIGSAAFYHCSNLSSISIPNCKYIKAYAFAGCSSLTSITFHSLEMIENGAFYDCKNLTSVYILSDVIPSIGNMSEQINSDYIIYVPSGMYEKYISEWSSLADHISSISNL